MVGEKMRDALRFRIEQGRMVGPVPLGYRREGWEVVIDPEWAPVVVRAFEEYATGTVSTRELAAKLNDEGLRPAKFAAGWRADTLAQILGHPAYVGLTPQDGRSGSGKLVPGGWSALITRALWDDVQRVRARHRPSGHVGGRPFRAYAFQGLLSCARCGGRMQAHTVKAGTYYRCRSTGAVTGCGQGVREDRLLPWGRSLMEWLERGPGWEAVRDAAEAALSVEARAPDALEQIDANLKRVGMRFEWGDITEDEYRERRGQLLALRADVETQAAPVAAALRFDGVLAAWDGGDMTVRRALVANVFAELDVADSAIVRARPRPEVAAEVSHRLAGWEGLGHELKLRFA
jgi:hypothetical protein